MLRHTVKGNGTAMKRRLGLLRWLLGGILGLLLLPGRPGVALAHPLGNFTINHYAEFLVQEEGIQIDYVLDMAEIPAFQAMQTMDTDGSGFAEADEINAYHPTQCQTIGGDLQLRVAGQPRSLAMAASAVTFPPGVGGLATLRLTCRFMAWGAVGDDVSVEFQDDSYAQRLGWREIVIRGQVPLDGDFLTASVSQQLTEYPSDRLATPLDQRQVRFRVRPDGGSDSNAQGESEVENEEGLLSGRSEDGFTRLITLQSLSVPALLLALLAAAVWGGLHALSPGHGKTIVGAYLVGSRGTWKHAFFLGLTTTLTHTAGVFLLGAITLFASHFILPEQLFPWLNVTSGVLVVIIGVNLFRERLNSALTGVVVSEHTHGHDHAYGHGHSREDGGDGHSHMPPGMDGAPVTWRSLLALGVSGGLLPCPSALIVMLSAIALGRIGFGLVLVLAFSVGLAAVLSGIGLLFIYAGRVMDRFSVPNRFVGWLPAASALFVTVAGLAITVKALLQIQPFL